MERNFDNINSGSAMMIPHFRVLGLILLATFISGSALLLALLKLDPYENSNIALPLFFLSFFFFLGGFFAIILFLLKRWKARDQVYVKHILISLRQGILLSTCTTVSLGLLTLGLLRIWNGLLMVALMMLLEFYLSGKDESH